jgi:hypothetical protein
MNKNFKKVISTVAALAMAASSFVAMAATYPDVTADSQYASAIEQLSALGIMEGFDDGTFKPDEKVTRAQMAKLVVGAKNMLAAAESNTTVMFEDVAPGKADWAIGYVATAANEGIINGTSATTFDPNATVTYAQATKMLVNACGFDAYAQQVGGWPSGYLSYGYTLGINEGISGVGNDTELTRGQVAQMVANALKAPTLEITGWYMDDGVMVPNYTEWDGDINMLKTLLTEYWDVYEVYGRVTQTSKQGAEIGEITFQVEDSENYDGRIYEKAQYAVNGVAVGETDAADHFLEYAYAMIALDSNDEATMVYIEAAGKNQTINFNDDLYAGFDGGYTTTASPLPSDVANSPKIKLYKSETSSSTSSYNVDTDVTLLVNGINMGKLSADATVTRSELDTFAALVNQYVVGDAVLVDTPKNGDASTDNKYDYITVDYYGTAVVQEVIEKSSGVKRIAFESYSTDINKAFLEIDPEDDKVEISVVDTNGNDVEISALAENDIISIAYKPGDFAGSNFYKIIVAKDVVEGSANGTYTENGTQYWTVGDADYKVAAGMSPDPISVGTSYVLYLDMNGNIAKTEVLAASVNYAIVDRFFTSAGDNKVRLILKDGTKADYILKADNTSITMDNSSTMSLSTAMGQNKLPLVASGNFITSNVQNTSIKSVDRFVKYTVNSSDEATLTNIAAGEIGTQKDKYNSTSNRIGSYGVAESSIILDASQFAADTSKSVAVSSMDYLVDDMQYTAVFAGKRNTSNGTYPMVVLLTGNNGYTVNSKMLVAAANVAQVQVDGVDKNQIKVYSGSAADAEEVLLVTEDTTVGANIQEGDAFICSINAEGEVDDIRVIFSVKTVGKAGMLAAVGSLDSKVQDDPNTQNVNEAITFNGEDANTIKFYMYPVVKKYSGSIALASDIATGQTITVKDPVTNQDTQKSTTVSSDTGVVETYANDVTAYAYDGTYKAGYCVSLTTTSGVVQSAISTSGKSVDGLKIDWENTANTPAYAVCREYDGDIQEVYSIFFE